MQKILAEELLRWADELETTQLKQISGRYFGGPHYACAIGVYAVKRDNKLFAREGVQGVLTIPDAQYIASKVITMNDTKDYSFSQIAAELRQEVGRYYPDMVVPAVEPNPMETALVS